MRKLGVLAVVALLSFPPAIQAQGKGHGGGPPSPHGAGSQNHKPDAGQSQGGGPVDHDRGGGKDRENPRAGQDKSTRGEYPGAKGRSTTTEHSSRATVPRQKERVHSTGRDRADDRGQRTKSIPRHEDQGADFRENGKINAQHDKGWPGTDFRIRTIDQNRYVWHEPVFYGCPPGLAKKGNGCLPPGQARKLAAFDHGYPHWYGYSDWYRIGPAYDWRYHQGYAYRVDPATALVQAMVPLLGGALFGGNPWPHGYVVHELPPYYVRYYGYDDAYRYHYADGVVFAVDPRTQVIHSIATLMTGQRWVVGSPMPPGYDFYNLPYEYRGRYIDNASSWYRYDDGYVYEIDPTTLLVRRVIELLVA